MDGSPLCIRSPFKELNGNFSAFVSTGVKNQGVSPIHVFRRNFEKYSPATELSFTLSDLTTTTPNDKGRSSLNVTPKRKLVLSESSTPVKTPAAILKFQAEAQATPVTRRNSKYGFNSEPVSFLFDVEPLSRDKGLHKQGGLVRLDSLRMNQPVHISIPMRENSIDDFDVSSQDSIQNGNSSADGGNNSMNFLFHSPSKMDAKDASVTSDPNSSDVITELQAPRPTYYRRNLFRSTTLSGDLMTQRVEMMQRSQDNDLGVAILAAASSVAGGSSCRKRSTPWRDNEEVSSTAEDYMARLSKRPCSVIEPMQSDSSPILFKAPEIEVRVKCNKHGKPPLLRSQSEVFVKHAMDCAETNKDLIGDCSAIYLLPSTVHSRHQDLRTISVTTMKTMLAHGFPESGDFDFITIDCRYPYEFSGGHIAGAFNLYTKQQIEEHFLSTAQAQQNQFCVSTTRRTVVVFHCEFSSERGPKMFRYLRNRDRDCHNESYPSLFFPEIYLLSGGYKEFYETSQMFCEPIGYLPMLHDNYTNELRRFRSKKAKYWTSAGSRRIMPRTGMRF